MAWPNPFNLALTTEALVLHHPKLCQSSFKCFCIREKLYYSVIKPRLVEFSSCGCSSAARSHLHTGSLKLSQRCYQVLGHFFDLLVMETTVRLGNFPCKLSLSTTGSSFQPHGLVFVLIQTVRRPSVHVCISFQIMSNHFNLPRMESNQGVETSQQQSKSMSDIWLQNFKCCCERSEYLCKCGISLKECTQI